MGSGDKIENIQALRAFAALSVVAAHLGAVHLSYPALSLPAPYFSAGGVDLFFVISGFIIAHVARRTWGDRRRFLMARAVRIYPMYWLACALTTPTFLALAVRKEQPWLQPGLVGPGSQGGAASTGSPQFFH